MYVYVTGGMDPSGEMDLNSEYLKKPTIKQMSVRICSLTIFTLHA